MHRTIPYSTGPHPKKTQVAWLEPSGFYRALFRFCMMSDNSLMVSRWTLSELRTELLPLGVYLEYIPSGRYLVLMGNVGTSKPHPALGQGTKTGDEGSLVLFIMVLRMLTRTSEIRLEKPMANREKSFEKNDPTICDEFGATACDKEGSALPYNQRSLVAGHESIIMKNALIYGRWQEVFRDLVLLTALLDRLIGLVFINNMTGQRSSIKEACR